MTFAGHSFPRTQFPPDIVSYGIRAIRPYRIGSVPSQVWLAVLLEGLLAEYSEYRERPGKVRREGSLVEFLADDAGDNDQSDAVDLSVPLFRGLLCSVCGGLDATEAARRRRGSGKLQPGRLVFR